ncbi:MAG: inositol monophosphatase [Rhodospirillaceae bacterium]|nr:inositol monophosphatase [Rhodospirillaceae bacterium]
MASRSPLINVMVKAAERAGRALIRDFGEVEHLQVSRKGPADFVSNADTKAERICYHELAKARPEYSFLMEEGGRVEGKDQSNVWIVDPLDGTTNFLHGLPHFAVSIGLQREGEPYAGVIFDPIKDELFWAERNVGAYLGDQRIRVSARQLLSESLLATGIPFRLHVGTDTSEKFMSQLESLMEKLAGIRRFGSAALDLAYVAAGRYEGFWENGLSSWDVAAGVVLVREAGGFVNEINGKRYMLGSPDILATNAPLQGPLKKILGKANSLVQS